MQHVGGHPLQAPPSLGGGAVTDLSQHLPEDRNVKSEDERPLNAVWDAEVTLGRKFILSYIGR